MDISDVVDLEHLRDTSRDQRECAAAMCAEARLMSERAGRMLTAAAATRTMLARRRSTLAARLPAA